MPVQHAQITLDQALARDQLLEKPRLKAGLNVTFLLGTNTKPYPTVNDEYSNVMVTFDASRNLPYTQGFYVGIGKSSWVDSDDIIVSDSFSSCVPVVGIYQDMTILAHCSGSLTDLGTQLPIDYRTGYFVIIARVEASLNMSKVRGLSEHLEGLAPGRVTTIGNHWGTSMIGVIVKGTNVIVYRHG